MARKRKVNEQPVSKVSWTLAAALEYIQAHNLMLCFCDPAERPVSVEVFSSTLKCPIGIRRAIHRHQSAVLFLLAQGSIATCASPVLHRRYWQRAKHERICTICLRLDALMIPILVEQGNVSA